jgi:hypothetical protein
MFLTQCGRGARRLHGNDVADARHRQPGRRVREKLVDNRALSTEPHGISVAPDDTSVVFYVDEAP